jgi:ATP-dependent Lon protease
MLDKLEEIKEMPESTRQHIREEIESLDYQNDTENAKTVSYLDNALNLPWDKYIEPFWDIKHTQTVLDSSHYGLHQTKQRILEFIAKNKRTNSNQGNFRCFIFLFIFNRIGAASHWTSRFVFFFFFFAFFVIGRNADLAFVGVGKTSIAQSIGKSLKRPVGFISLSGQSDPVHIKGSKRTYIGAHSGFYLNLSI